MTYHEVFSALADSTRRQIFESLRHDALSVGELAFGRGVSRPAVSQHLKVLQQAGLVDVKANGSRRIYSIRLDGLREARQYLDRLCSDVLANCSEQGIQQPGDELAQTGRQER